MRSRLEQRFTLPNGRRLGFDEHGEPDGHPVLYFHGTPSARVEWEFFGSKALLETLNLRIIAVDRPGMGLSDFQPGRRLRDWPADVRVLADHLGLQRFAVLGYSGGVPYAAVCAAKIPDRLTAAGMVGVVGPFDRPGLTDGINPQNLQFLYMSRDRPRLARSIQRMMAVVARFAPGSLIAQAMNALPQPDRVIMAHPRGRAAFLHMVQESVRSGTRGPQLDTALMVSPWDFALAEIQIPVYLWQGGKDRNAPPAMAYFLAAAIPQSQLAFYPDEGHLSIMANHAKEIFRTLTSGSR